MAGITLAHAQAQLDLWLDRLSKVGVTKSYEINGRSQTRFSLTEIQGQVDYWDRQVRRLSRGGIRVRQVKPLG